MVGIAKHLPSCAGIQLETELASLSGILDDPDRPIFVVVGGAKISTKLSLLNYLALNVDAIVIGGAMANTFLLARGINVGKSLAEYDLVSEAKKILDAASFIACDVVLPEDIVVVDELKHNAKSRVYSVYDCRKTQ